MTFTNAAKFVLLVATVLQSVILMGSDDLRFETTGTKTIVVHFDNTATEKITVRLIDVKGAEVFTERIQAAAGYSKKYNLKELANGQYTILIESPSRYTTQKVTVKDHIVEVRSEEEKTFFKPFIKQDAKLVDINLMALGNDVEITVKDNNGSQVYRTAYQGESRIHKRLNLTQLPSGDYILQVKNGGRYTTRHIRL